MRSRWILASVLCAHASAQDFAGTWLLQEVSSQNAALPAPPAPRLIIRQAAGKFTCAECGPGGWTFTTDRKSTETRSAAIRNSVAAKWEGNDLMVNAMVHPVDASQYVVMDQWRLSSGGSRLTITREVQRGGLTSNAKLVYLRDPPAAPAGSRGGEELAPSATLPAERPPLITQPEPTLRRQHRDDPPVAAPDSPARPEPVPLGDTPAAAPPAAASEREHLLEAGARLPLRSLSAFSSKSAQEGDRVYLETAQPVSRFGKLLLPTGTQITATIAFAQGAGRVKGRGELMLRFESLTTPDGVTKDFRAQVTGADATAGQVDREGRIRSAGNKGSDAGTVGTSTATGAIIGAGLGRAGVGAAAGAAAGLARVLGSRGPDVNIRRGDLVEMSLDRAIHFTGKEVR